MHLASFTPALTLQPAGSQHVKATHLLPATNYLYTAHVINMTHNFYVIEHMTMIKVVMTAVIKRMYSLFVQWDVSPQ